MRHVVLLGDSVFDNGAYAGNGGVIQQLRALIPATWRASLCAVDGSTTIDVPIQLDRTPADATHLVVSVGGNDALAQTGILGETADSMARALSRLADIAGGFERNYRTMLDTVLDRGLPAAFCTIYYPQFPNPLRQRLAVTALTVFNDSIIREVVSRGLPLLDLRLICSDPADYANAVEPSAQGGGKIAAAIHRLIGIHDFGRHRTEVFAG